MWYKINGNKMVNLDKIYTIYSGVTNSNQLVIWLNYDEDESKAERIIFDTQEERDIEYNKLQDKLLNRVSISTIKKMMNHE